jgi:hypothetical protein
MFHFEAAHFSRGKVFVGIGATTQLAQSVCLEVAANGGIGRQFLGAQGGNQVLVVQLDR